MSEMTLVPGVRRPDREMTPDQPCSVNVAPAPRPDPPEPYDGFDETTNCTDKPARAERVIDNESEDQ